MKYTVAKLLGALLVIFFLPKAILAIVNDTPPGGGPHLNRLNEILVGVPVAYLGVVLFILGERKVDFAKHFPRQALRDLLVATVVATVTTCALCFVAD